MKLTKILLVLVALSTITCYGQGKKQPKFALPESNPCYIDPETGGSADPCMVWNPIEKEWFMYYTQRRAHMEDSTVKWMHGCRIGIASSKDGKQWRFRGTCTGDDGLTNRDNETEPSTWWAPDVIYDKESKLFHMYATQVPEIHATWAGGTRDIRHFTSKDGIDWKFQSILPPTSDRVIDACVYDADGKWLLWYKDERDNSYTWVAESQDLYKWTVKGSVITDIPHEAPAVWEYDGKFWMITDAWEHDLRVYTSDNGVDNWKYSSTLKGSHGAVYNINGKVIFLCHKANIVDRKPHPRQTAIHISELKYVDGKFTE